MYIIYTIISNIKTFDPFYLTKMYISEKNYGKYCFFNSKFIASGFISCSKIGDSFTGCKQSVLRRVYVISSGFGSSRLSRGSGYSSSDGGGASGFW